MVVVLWGREGGAFDVTTNGGAVGRCHIHTCITSIHAYLSYCQSALGFSDSDLTKAAFASMCQK